LVFVAYVLLVAVVKSEPLEKGAGSGDTGRSQGRGFIRNTVKPPQPLSAEDQQTFRF
jgi:hypothetical protein